LFPARTPLEEILSRDDDVPDDVTPQEPTTGEVDTEFAAAVGPAESESEEFDLSLANAYQPSSIGVSFLADFPEHSELVVEVTGGRYQKKTVWLKSETVPKEPTSNQGQSSRDKRRSRTWWLRTPLSFQTVFQSNELAQNRNVLLRRGIDVSTAHNSSVQPTGQPFHVRVEVYSRPQAGRLRLLTVCLVNRTPAPAKRGVDESCFFQARFVVTVRAHQKRVACILPYPTVTSERDPEEESLALLYRDTPTFGTGHGCSADWETDVESGLALSITAECLPSVTTPNITPDVRREDGSTVEVRMADLARPDDWTNGRVALDEVVELYEHWIARQRDSIAALPANLRITAVHHLNQCEVTARRMRDGLTYLDSDPVARKAFMLANHAILLQQIAGGNPRRPGSLDLKSGRVSFVPSFVRNSPHNLPEGKGAWRPFQIAFLLATIRSSVEATSPDRNTVELIWFPTGGGKTEAYLGLAAFAMFKRRLDNASDVGVHVLMRYTLRLLTTQQFQRASGLLCAMEYLRRLDQGVLGTEPFSIGIWLGGATTPNTREQALRALSEYERDSEASSPFLLTRCPWCGAEFTRIEYRTGRPSGKGRSKTVILGYVRAGGTVVLQCPDPACDFAAGLPIRVIDEDVYATRPTLVIGTIDKFAILAWRPEARALFGIDLDGVRTASPPGLIIQDELHLIAGPLGSLAGLYETTIEELCTDHRGAHAILPKIISSTATIRRYVNQIKALYGRHDVALFPPPGLKAGDSFFASYEQDSPGRVYVGVQAVSLGSVQTEWLRTFAALFQAPMALSQAERDPWWTMVIFFNSIREMGTAHTLLQSDVPDYLKVIWARRSIPVDQRRYVNASRVFELTGGLESGQIADAIAKLNVGYPSARDSPIDICLASNVIEVGIDILRLALMIVAGQPKTTSQYIQVTGRVGRTKGKPALIVTMYSPSKPRDRSHFERFRSYHEQLYANVEPSSVTPFSPPAMERALHAALVAYARQAFSRHVARSPYPFPEEVLRQFRSLLLLRTDKVDPDERDNALSVLERRIREWRGLKRVHWAREMNDEDPPLLRIAGDYVPPGEAHLSWSTPTSMRNVDAQCVAEITTKYLASEDEA